MPLGLAFLAVVTPAITTGDCQSGGNIKRKQQPASGLRDHEHHGDDGESDAADGKQPDDVEPQRYVGAGSQRMLQLALALCTDDQQPDRKRPIAAAEQHVRPCGDIEQLRGEPAHTERAGGCAQRGAPPRQPGALRSHRRTPRLIEIGRRRRNWRRLVFGVSVLWTRRRLRLRHSGI
jgi:hypothetical protein